MEEMNTYLKDGKPEELCLGLVSETEAAAILQAAKIYPELNEQILETENALLQSTQLKPKEKTKAGIMRLLEELGNEEIPDLKNPPVINRFSDAVKWNTIVKGLTPLFKDGSAELYPIKTAPGLEMFVAWVNGSLEEEGHDVNEFEESFLILEGSCECDLGGEMYYLTAGDFLMIPPKTHHIIKATTPGGGYVKAILQRRKAA
jgi:mannose-6-phosphate isomerase-like protein (cupin superfamily)